MEPPNGVHENSGLMSNRKICFQLLLKKSSDSSQNKRKTLPLFPAKWYKRQNKNIATVLSREKQAISGINEESIWTVNYLQNTWVRRVREGSKVSVEIIWIRLCSSHKLHSGVSKDSTLSIPTRQSGTPSQTVCPWTQADTRSQNPELKVSHNFPVVISIILKKFLLGSQNPFRYFEV